MQRPLRVVASSFGCACLLALVTLAGIPRLPSPGAPGQPGVDVARAAADTPTPTPNVITVTAEGQASGTPTVAYLTLGVQSTGATAQEALSNNSAAMQGVIAKIQQQGVASKDVQTADVSIQPQEERQPNGQVATPPKIAGYVATNTVVVTVRNLSTVGQVLDASVGAGANVAQGVRFGVDDPTALQQQAITQAVKSAKAQADTVAQAAGVTIAGLQSVTVEQPSPVVPKVAAMASAAPAPATPVQPGQLSVTVQVTAVYRLQ